ncbi:hypothetical protein AZJ79_07715, partial [Streptococcus pneumoniae]
MKSTIKNYYEMWTKRHERRYREALGYYNQQSKEALLAELTELEIKKERSSRSWKLLVGLVLTIIFSDDLKRLLAILFSPLTGVPTNKLHESVLPSISIALFIVLLFLTILIYSFSYSLLL